MVTVQNPDTTVDVISSKVVRSPQVSIRLCSRPPFVHFSQNIHTPVGKIAFLVLYSRPKKIAFLVLVWRYSRETIATPDFTFQGVCQHQSCWKIAFRGFVWPYSRDTVSDQDFKRGSRAEKGSRPFYNNTSFPFHFIAFLDRHIQRAPGRSKFIKLSVAVGP